jgi:hypothetical protein
MNDTTKKGLLIVVVVVALVVAGFGAKKFIAGDQMQVENTVKMPAGHKSQKQPALDAQKNGGNVEPFVERDLGG